MSKNLFDYNVISIREAGYDEAWLQNQICESPQKIGLGDLRLVAKEKIVSSGGRLDILLQDGNEEKLYEVEVQLGETDPSHIIRTIEYWDLVRKKYPQRQHYAVILAEGITKRFFNVINLLSANIPIIAIKCSIVEIDGNRSLVFTDILNTYEEPEDLSTESNIIVNKKYWESFSPQTFRVSQSIYEEIKDLYNDCSIELNKWSIAIKSLGYNQIRFNKRSGDFVMIEMKYGKDKTRMFEMLENSGIQATDKYNQVRFTTTTEWVGENKNIIRSLCELNNLWWKETT